MNKILGLIPARGGSKTIPRKNITPLAGRPLLAYTCEAALGSKMLARVVLSTDDQEIAEVGLACSVEVPFLRPSELAQDNTPSVSVAEHALRWLSEHDSFEPDVLVLLQPTSPFRQARHIDEALEQMQQTGADTVVSVAQVPHRFSPYSIMQLRDGWLSDFWQERVSFDRFRRQDQPVLFARNGPAILATRVIVISERQSFYGRTIAPYVMTEEESLDIDRPFDLRLAECLIAQADLN
jgi:CMP-N,N'-diacetyllegionaminic acid synthase